MYDAAIPYPNASLPPKPPTRGDWANFFWPDVHLCTLA